MVEGGESPAFPVVFFDGMKEMNIGKIKVYPTLEFKPFQLRLSQKIGISPNQISIYLVERWAHKKSMFGDDRRRIPITSKVNFRLICRQKDCCFLVVLKRSRKMRNRRERVMNGVGYDEFLNVNEYLPPVMPENPILLRRNDSIAHAEQANLNARLQSLNFHRENYQMAVANSNVNGGLGYGSDLDTFPTVDDVYGIPAKTEVKKNLIFCRECENSRKDGLTASFHPCVNDEVVYGCYMGRFGPISRPKNPVH